MHAQADRLFLEFWVPFLCACRYEHETGRESALELLASIFTSFPEVSFQTNNIAYLNFLLKISQYWCFARSLTVGGLSCENGRPSIFAFCPFSREKIEKLIKVYWIWQVATVGLINHNVGAIKSWADGCKYKQERAKHYYWRQFPSAVGFSSACVVECCSEGWVTSPSLLKDTCIRH